MLTIYTKTAPAARVPAANFSKKTITSITTGKVATPPCSGAPAPPAGPTGRCWGYFDTCYKVAHVDFPEPPDLEQVADTIEDLHPECRRIVVKVSGEAIVNLIKRAGWFRVEREGCEPCEVYLDDWFVLRPGDGWGYFIH